MKSDYLQLYDLQREETHGHMILANFLSTQIWCELAAL